jgi:hypothetical protein
LLKKLPSEGTNWNLSQRTKWLQTAANIFDLMFESTDDGEIEIKFVPPQDVGAVANKNGGQT